MSLSRHLSPFRRHVCRQCTRRLHTELGGQRPKKPWAGEERDEVARNAAWEEQAGMIRSGAQQSILSMLEQRGFVKDVAGGWQTLSWLLTEKRIGAYVGVDPTAPSLHVGHLLPLMVLYWMYLHGYYTVSLVGGATAMIGDPSGRTTARSQQDTDARILNTESISIQLRQLWRHVNCLGIKHQYSPLTSRKQSVMDNWIWMRGLSAIDLMSDLGSGMRLGPMLARDSVKLRMESGEGMAMSEFSYPLFQAYDWWHMYKENGVQVQIGGSDQYGNICAGMDVVHHMRKVHRLDNGEDDPRVNTYGFTTPLLTTASGEKFGKSAGNAIWLDKTMMNSFDLYQYFLRTADDDVERYLKLFTFIPLDHIQLLMGSQREDASKRFAQHVLAKEVVELAHGAGDAKKAAQAHKEAFRHGTNTFSLGVLRSTLASVKPEVVAAQASTIQPLNIKTIRARERHQAILTYRKNYIASITPQSSSPAPSSTEDIITLPLPLLQPGSFPRILHAAGLASSRSDGHRLIAKRGAYVVVPNSGDAGLPDVLKWTLIAPGAAVDPNHFLVDFEALVLRAGKSKVKVVRIVTEETWKEEGRGNVGWGDEVEGEVVRDAGESVVVEEGGVEKGGVEEAKVELHEGVEVKKDEEVKEDAELKEDAEMEEAAEVDEALEPNEDAEPKEAVRRE